jgi:hypothetical protein
MARFPSVLKNVGLVSGPVWRSGVPGAGLGWEIGYDHFVRTCLVHKPFWGAGFGRQDGVGDRSAIWSARFSMSPYHVYLDRHWKLMTLTSVRLSHWSTRLGATDCIRPEAGFQMLCLNDLFSPKLAVCYGREFRIGGSVEQPIAPASTDVVTIQVGITLNLGALSYRKFIRRREAEKVVAPRP